MMNEFFSILPAWLLFIIVVGGSIGLVCVGKLLVRRPMKNTYNEVAGFFFSTASVVYAVLLAFVVISVWDNFQAADQATSQEASDIITVARDSLYFPEPFRSEVHDRLRSYTELVINNDWGNKRDDQEYSLGSSVALAEFNSLYSTYQQLPQNAVNANALRSLDNLSNQRVLRILSSKAILPSPFWVALVLGAGVVIYFGLIFYLENSGLHVFMLILLTGLTTTCIWLILVINNPYIGDTRVSTEAFKYALHIIDTLPR